MGVCVDCSVEHFSISYCYSHYYSNYNDIEPIQLVLEKQSSRSHWSVSDVHTYTIYGSFLVWSSLYESRLYCVLYSSTYTQIHYKHLPAISSDIYHKRTISATFMCFPQFTENGLFSDWDYFFFLKISIFRKSARRRILGFNPQK